MNQRTFRTVHPAVLVTAACFLVLLFNTLHGMSLLGATAFCMLLAAGICRDRLIQLIRRIWVLLLILSVVMLWHTPGILVWPRWGDFSPTREGLLIAGEQALRLLGTVAVVAILVHYLRPTEMVTGLVRLTSPLRWLGVDTTRMAIRIQLVLDSVANPDVLDWRNALRRVEPPVAPMLVELSTAPYRARDTILMCVMGLAAVGVLMW